MKKLLLIFTLLFSTLMFSTPSYGEWTMVAKTVDATFYVDFERIRKHGGYVHWWSLVNYLKPTMRGNLSHRAYQQGDCKVFRNKLLTWSHHKEPMGGGDDSGWRYPPPNFADEVILKRVCSQVMMSGCFWAPFERKKNHLKACNI
jgi:hypothetical protein